MSLGDAWTESTPGSVSKLNQVTTINGTGGYLVTLDKTKHKLFVCTSTGSGLTADHVYLCNAAGDALIDITAIQSHTHDASTEGGTFFGILKANQDVMDSGMFLILNPDKAHWNDSASGTASVTNDTDGTTQEKSILFQTGATSASVARIKQHSIEMDMSKRSFFKCLVRTTGTADTALKFGIGAESLAGADNNTRKYGVEFCTTVNGNYHIFAATGSARSASDTGTALDVNRTSFRLEHYPDLGTPKIDAYINEGTVFTKTTNVPSTNAADEPPNDNIFSFSLKNNAASNKSSLLYGVRFVYQTVSDWN